MRASLDRGFFFVCIAVAVGGCQIASPTYVDTKEVVDNPDASAADGSAAKSAQSNPAPGGGGGGGDGGSSSSTCGTSDFVKPDLSTLTACGDGKGHCFDKTKAPIADLLTACPNAGQVCVPDEILTANGSPLKSCTSIIGPGGCVTASLIPEIEQQGGSALKQDSCNAGQLCVPCTDPTHNNAPTPFCQPIGVHSGTCTGGGGGGGPAPSGDAGSSASMACCVTGGHVSGICIAESAIPESDRDQTMQDVCTSGNKCVPSSLASGAPVMCDGGILGRGICMDKCFSGFLSLADSVGLLDRATCGSTELCLPCSVLPDGVPGCS